MAKKYPLKQILIHRNQNMEMILNEKETMAVIEAGLKATGLAKDITVSDINVTQSRKTGKATIALQVDTEFGSDEDEDEVVTPEPVQQELPLTPVVEEEPANEPVTETVTINEEAKEEVVAEEPVQEPLVQIDAAIAEEPEAQSDSLFGASEPEVKSDSLFG